GVAAGLGDLAGIGAEAAVVWAERLDDHGDLLRFLDRRAGMGMERRAQAQLIADAGAKIAEGAGETEVLLVGVGGLLAALAANHDHLGAGLFGHARPPHYLLDVVGGA